MHNEQHRDDAGDDGPHHKLRARYQSRDWFFNGVSFVHNPVDSIDSKRGDLHRGDPQAEEEVGVGVDP